MVSYGRDITRSETLQLRCGLDKTQDQAIFTNDFAPVAIRQ